MSDYRMKWNGTGDPREMPSRAYAQFVYSLLEYEETATYRRFMRDHEKWKKENPNWRAPKPGELTQEQLEAMIGDQPISARS